MNSIASVNDARYAAFLGVVGGKLAIINFKGLNAQMIADGIPKGATMELRIAVNDTSSNGNSVYIISIVK